MVDNPWTWGLGRRKSAIARVRIKPGSGGFVVNGKPMDVFFPVLQQQRSAASPLLVLEEDQPTWDVFVNVQGGGTTGQAEAVRLGLARALKRVNPTLDPVLREGGHLTRDSRMKERKKPGRRGARRGFQFSKR
jgi:small subunit ribosomal protein S9